MTTVNYKSKPMKVAELRRLIQAGKFCQSIAEVEVVE